MYGNVAIFPMPVSRVNPWSCIIDLEEEPLSKRCWALQERYLSSRTLHFASTQIYFECRSDFYPQDRHLKHKDSEDNFKIHRRATAKNNASPEDAWEHIVRRYSERYLTVESDKLPAIGGLAARVSFEQGLNDNPGDEYLAGLWKKNLILDLVWQTYAGDIKRSTPTSYTAPSWSWASVNEPVVFTGDRDGQSLAVVNDAKVDLENSGSPFGKVTGGWVHLSGIKLHPCDMDDYDDFYIREGDARFRVNSHMDSSRFDLPEMCVADYIDKLSELVAVPLMLKSEMVDLPHENDNSVPGAYFLLLIASPSRQDPFRDFPCFRRVGVGYSYIEKLEGNENEARRRLRDRCMEAIERGTLEDIIIV